MNKSINMRNRNEEIMSYKTPYEKERRERELKLYNEYVALTADEGNSKTMVMKSLIKKHGCLLYTSDAADDIALV